MGIKVKKRKRSSRMHGRGMGTHGRGFRKRARKSGHHGGPGMAGSGKRADHKKTLVLKLYGHGYFGKQGITSKGTERDKRKRVNIEDLEKNLSSYIKKGVAKKSGKGFEIDLSDFKILGGSKNYEIKNALFIKAKEASSSAVEKVKKSGGEIILK